jgi:cell division protein FtsN
MSDQNFHEIQLSGKQLLFLFMCIVVLTVVVFLFGVSVGREVRGGAAQAAGAATPPSSSPTTETVVPADTPPPTQTAANELSYAQALQGQTKDAEDPSKVTPPVPAAEEPPSTPPAKAEAPAAPPKTAAIPTPAPPTPAPKAAPPAAAKATPPAAKTPTKTVPALTGWQVQVGAYSGNDVASQQVAKLQGKGFPAFVFTEPETTPGPRFKVLVGPYSARTEADAILKSLAKEGYKPFLKR